MMLRQQLSMCFKPLWLPAVLSVIICLGIAHPSDEDAVVTYAIPLGSITTVGGTQYIGDDDDSSSDSHEPDEKQTHPPPTPAHGPTTSSPAKGGEGSYTLVKPILPSITDGTHDAIKDATLKSNDVAIRSVTGSGGSGLPAPPPTPATPNASDPSAVPGHSTVVNTASGLSNTEESGLSQSGLIAGIVVGSIALLVSIMALVYCCLLQRGYRSGEFECSEEVVLPGIEESQDVELTALPESSEAESGASTVPRNARHYGLRDRTRLKSPYTRSGTCSARRHGLRDRAFLKSPDRFSE